jgi:tetratricopeptide (TPR) repeat protein
VIPRWRPFRAALRTGEFTPTRIPIPIAIPADALKRVKDQWHRNRTLSFAADVISSAIALGEPSLAEEEAGFLLASGGNVPEPAKSLARRVLGLPEPIQAVPDPDPISEESVRGAIRGLRRNLHEDPGNVFWWTDLSFFYSVAGVGHKATSAMEMALRLAPFDRYVLRSAARLFVHAGDIQRAHALIRNNERTSYDPWLLAAEIAIAGSYGRPPKFAITARRTLGSGLRWLHVSELASALGTLELHASTSSRLGRKFIDQSLMEPTENAVAQAAWNSRNFGGMLINGSILRTSSEAKTWDTYRAGNWRRALGAAEAWLIDQPFSSRPALIASYLASVGTEDYDKAARLARNGLRANPGNQMLLNNLAYALAEKGELTEAGRVLNVVDADHLNSREVGIVTATRGLIAYREGNAPGGRALYLTAIDRLKESEPARSLIAQLYLAIEETRARVPGAVAATRDAFEATAKIDSPDVILLRDRLIALSQKTDTPIVPKPSVGTS